MRARGIAGLGIAVSDASGTLWSSGFGVADRASGRGFDSGTISNIGSVSKLFTATAIMKLVQEGRIDLDAPVSTYLPDFAPKNGAYDPAGVTIRGLLTHHSGPQSDYIRGFMSGSAQPAGYPRPYADNARLASETALCAAPGDVMSYSNLGYSLLGLVAEAVSGKDFPSYVRDSVFEPLGMSSSSFLIEDRFKDRCARAPSGGQGRRHPLHPRHACGLAQLERGRHGALPFRGHRRRKPPRSRDPDRDVVEAEPGLGPGLRLFDRPRLLDHGTPQPSRREISRAWWGPGQFPRPSSRRQSSA